LGILEPEDRLSVVAAKRAPVVTHYSVPANTQLDKAAIIHADGQGDQITHGHIVVSVGANAKATIVVEHEGLSRYSELVSLVVGAYVTLWALQLYDASTQQMGHHNAILRKYANFKLIYVILGSDIALPKTHLRYSEPGGDAELLGLSYADAGQHLEHQTYICH